MNFEVLYKRNAKGDIIEWNIHENDDKSVDVDYGLFNGSLHHEHIPSNKVKTTEFKSRVNAKRKEGYKSIDDLWDNSSIEDINTRNDLYKYLNLYLPKFNTTDSGFVLPMLAKTLEDNKPFDKYGTYLGQWKINGLRCIVGIERTKDLFQTIKFTYTSREGTRWDLSWMDEIMLLNIKQELLDLMLEEDVKLDGELYIPGYSVNEINSFVKNKELPQHYLLQYWCYDLCYENASFESRYKTLCFNTTSDVSNFINNMNHIENEKQFVILPIEEISSFNSAIDIRDRYIDLGFEGLILRNPSAEYQFGKRNTSMYKFKKKEDGMFIIIDIKEDKRGLPIYVLQNDINDELFECTINLPQDKQRQQLALREHLLGKRGLVEYRERSGVKQVPFHAKLIKILL